MILQFKTARNTNGNRRYLLIDTGAEIFTRNCPRFIMEGIEIKTRDYNELIKQLENNGFIEKAYPALLAQYSVTTHYKRFTVV